MYAIRSYYALQVRLKAFSKTLTWIVAGFTLAILITGLIMGGSFLDMLRSYNFV